MEILNVAEPNQCRRFGLKALVYLLISAYIRAKHPFNVFFVSDGLNWKSIPSMMSSKIATYLNHQIQFNKVPVVCFTHYFIKQIILNASISLINCSTHCSHVFVLYIWQGFNFRVVIYFTKVWYQCGVLHSQLIGQEPTSQFNCLLSACSLVHPFSPLLRPFEFALIHFDDSPSKVIFLGGTDSGHR